MALGLGKTVWDTKLVQMVKRTNLPKGEVDEKLCIHQ